MGDEWSRIVGFLNVSRKGEGAVITSDSTKWTVRFIVAIPIIYFDIDIIFFFRFLSKFDSKINNLEKKFLEHFNILYIVDIGSRYLLSFFVMF